MLGLPNDWWAACRVGYSIMTNDWAIVTVVTRNYLHFARALALSVREIHPDARVIACVVDPLPAGVAEANEPFEILPFGALAIAQAQRFLFQYTPFELTCALKAYVLEHVFRSTQVSRLLYFDGDIQVCSSLAPLLANLESGDIVLTTHLSRPRDPGGLDRWEMDVLDTGIFNGGFLGVKNSPAGRAMLGWWKKRMEQLCKWEINHHDQGWLDAVPALFDGVRIERGGQYNAAVWNLETREFSETPAGQILVDGQPLVFFHFASIDPGQDGRLSKVSRRPLGEEPAPVQRLFREYKKRLHGCGLAECVRWGYAHGRLADGTPIRPEWRELVRANHPQFAGVENPFNVPAAEYRRAAAGEKWKRLASRARRILKPKAA